MSKLSIQYIKDNFPQYQSYFTDTNGDYDEDVLQSQLNLAEVQISTYVTLPEQLTDQLSLHIFNICRYRGFNLRHGDTQLDVKPQIVKDYEETIKLLTAFKAGESLTGPEITDTDTSTPEQIRITAKQRRFNEWTDGPQSISNPQ